MCVSLLCALRLNLFRLQEVPHHHGRDKFYIFDISALDNYAATLASSTLSNSFKTAVQLTQSTNNN